MQKKVLILTYYWPPSGGSGVQRWVYFAKYLKRLGVDPIILTVDPNKASFPSEDKSLLEETKGVKVIHTNSFEPLQLYSKLITGNKKKGVPYGSVPTSRQSPFKKAAAFIRGNMVLPDARKYWKRYAIAAGRKLLSNEKIDVMISTGPPHSTHLIAQQLKNEFHLPWIADFRDPWTEIFYNKDLYRTSFAKKRDAKMEATVLNQADAVLAISPGTANLLTSKMKVPSKIHCILNGYDHEQFKGIKKIKHTDFFVISYVGYLGKHHQYNVFINGLKLLVKTLKDKKIKLHLAGNIEPLIYRQLEKIEGITIQHEGQVSHQRALTIISSAHLLFISIPNSEYAMGNIPGKLLEYTATGNPIILAGEKESNAAEIVGEFSNTTVVSDDEAEIFADFSLKVASGEIRRNNNLEVTYKYTREATTKRLFNLINQIS